VVTLFDVDNYEGREFDSRTRLVVGWAAWLGPSSEGGFMRSFGVLGPKFKRVFLVGVRRVGTSSEHVATISLAGFGRQRRLL